MDDIINNGIVASAVKSAMGELGPEDVTNRGKVEPLAQQKLAEALNAKYGEDATAARQKIENETAIAKAEADKTVAIKNAEAKAEKMKIEAEVQTDANKKVAKSISDELIDNIVAAHS